MKYRTDKSLVELAEILNNVRDQQRGKGEGKKRIESAILLSCHDA